MWLCDKFKLCNAVQHPSDRLRANMHAPSVPILFQLRLRLIKETGFHTDTRQRIAVDDKMELKILNLCKEGDKEPAKLSQAWMAVAEAALALLADVSIAGIC